MVAKAKPFQQTHPTGKRLINYLTIFKIWLFVALHVNPFPKHTPSKDLSCRLTLDWSKFRCLKEWNPAGNLAETPNAAGYCYNGNLLEDLRKISKFRRTLGDILFWFQGLFWIYFGSLSICSCFFALTSSVKKYNFRLHLFPNH